MVYVATIDGESPLATFVVTEVTGTFSPTGLVTERLPGLIDEELTELAPV